MRFLTNEEVKQAKKNIDVVKPYKTTKEIIFSNVFTFFNGMILVLAFFVATTLRFENLLFVLVIVINTVIGIYQEVKSKNALEKLSLISRAKYKVNRDNKVQEIDIYEIVLGEYLNLNLGDQIPCDGVLIAGEIEVDESLLTGESDNIYKKVNDKLLSGSNIVSGSGLMKVTAVGEDSYINKLAQDSKKFKKYPSKLRDYLNTILKYISFLLVPVAIILYLRGKFIGLDYVDIVLNSAGALVGMIPEGLVLLVSVSLAVSAYKLTKKKVLVQELYCTETLARIDVLCFDKTGTITTGNMNVVAIDELAKEKLSSYLAYFDDENATSRALKKYLRLEKKWHVIKKGAFSSRDKFSYIQVKDEGTYFFGAFEFLDIKEKLASNFEEYKNNGYRILTLAFSKDFIDKPKDTELIGNVVLSDEIKENTKQTFDYFNSQGVDIKIISGDNHKAVLGVAKKAGFNKNALAVDMTKVSDEDFESVVLNNQIFGRVSPNQKEKMVEILQKNGKTVAMSGDGVNDVLALKKADISFGMKEATSAVKSVANIVLLTDDFGVFYNILMEGRRVINNIQKVAALFLTKTFFSISFAILSVIFAMKFPFIPIQFTVISALTIGIPSFFLTFEENKQIVKNNFMKEVLTNASLAGSILVGAVLLVNIFQINSSIAFILALLNGLLMVYRVSLPLNSHKKLLLYLLILGGVLGVCANIFILEKSFVSLTLKDIILLLITFIFVVTLHLLTLKKQVKYDIKK
ncbi:HAD-IC family P-type ATPase [Gemella sp. zg-570]|uniref:HAD-IC family P-type ATPase n=1 Tax=Gemella sp. zg-570 TaxID=2840371 RepID=UPI001C0B9217|nr:HAD-IC family P-type ATPase [Gemella sp. zg-570]QWQ38714.1 HAD-IC family P-type ATPase [Gemella sp. zg-570]